MINQPARVLVGSLALLLTPEVIAQETATPPSLASAQVTLPYTELRALWEAAQAKTAPTDTIEDELSPPVGFVVTSAKYHVAPDSEKTDIVADIAVRILQPSWQSVPLVGGDIRLAHAEFLQPELPDAEIAWVDDVYRLLVGATGTVTIRLDLVAATPSRWPRRADGVQHLVFTPAAATVSELTISPPDAGSSPLRASGGATRTGEHSFALSPDGDGIVLEVGEPESPPPPPPAPLAPSIWDTSSQVVVRPIDGRLHYDAKVFAQTDGGAADSIILELPPSASAIRVNFEEGALAPKVGRTPAGNRSVTVQLPTPEVFDRRLDISYQVPLAPSAAAWELTAPSSTGGEILGSLFAIVVADGLEIAGDRDPATAQLAASIRESLGAEPFVLATSDSASATVSPRWLPRVRTAKAIIETARFTSRLVADGASLTEATYEITHTEPVAWRLDLPPGHELLACDVDGRSATPIWLGEDTLELSIRPNGSPTTVNLSYTEQRAPFDPVSGRLEASLPKTDLFIQRLGWYVALPESYLSDGVMGNIQQGCQPGKDETCPLPNTLFFRRDLCRGDRPSAEIHYRRRSLED